MSTSSTTLTVLVTGAARGIGNVLTDKLLAQGHRVVAGDIDEQALAVLDAHPSLTTMVLDVADPDSVKTFYAEAASLHGNVDVLVNNAGFMPIGPFRGFTTEVISRTVEVDLLGVMYGCSVAVDAMLTQGSGHIINIASVAGRITSPGLAVYNGAKFGVLGFTEALALELRHTPVQVSAVLPAFTQTELIAGIRTAPGIKAIPPDLVADEVIKLLSGPGRIRTVPRAYSGTALFGAVPLRAKAFLADRLKADRMFTHPNHELRRAYVERTER